MAATAGWWPASSSAPAGRFGWRPWCRAKPSRATPPRPRPAGTARSNPWQLTSLDGADLVVDALFGAGLARPLEGMALALVESLNASGLPVVAVDVPSGVDGATGAVMGVAPRAALTVTFCRLKPGHLLLPGRLHCGPTRLADIGIPDRIVAAHACGLHGNGPALWRHLLPARTAESHKYRFGHALVVGGPVATTGAARLAATAALRVGAGLASVSCPPGALTTYAAQLTSVMTKPAGGAAGLAAQLADARFNAVLLGPGAGVGEATRDAALVALATGRAVVLDADALTSFADHRGDLFAALSHNCVLTPHDGEFARLFEFAGDRLARARAASATCGAVVVLKGGDTVVAAPDGRAAIQAEAPPALATAGTGDVLAGLILGLLAQGMPAFEAAAAGVWLHAQAARLAGPGMIAEDLAQQVAGALRAAGTAF